MEKLIELLNEHMQPYIKYKGWNVPGRYFINYDEGADLHEEEVISKKFGFIKWLVENDKIDLGNNMLGIEWSILDNYGYENGLLMLLSISNSPIEDLISYLR